MSDPKPLVSAVIPTYNREKLLLRAVRSVLSQSYRPIEILIVDDASTDHTAEAVKDLLDTNIRYIRHETNQGGSAARNTGWRHSKGEYIAFLDGDDEWLPDKIQKQIERFSTLDASYGMVYTGFDFLDAEGHFIKRQLPVGAVNFEGKLLAENTVGTTSTIMVRREAIEKIGGFDPQMKSCQDWDLYIRLYKVCAFDYLKEPLVRYYQLKAPNRISNNKGSVVQGHLRIQDKFRKDIDGLPLSLRLRHLNNFSHIYLNQGAVRLSLSMLAQALQRSGNPLNFLRMGKRISDFIAARMTANR